MTKKYKLLKDLPDSKPGDIYIWNDSQKAYYKDGNVLDSYWNPESVENKPTWFEEIKEQEWKIMTCFNNKTEAWQEKDWHWYVSPEDTTTISCCIKDKCRIRSVIRLSDKQLFSIGDEVEYRSADCTWEQSCYKAVIKEIKKNVYGMLVFEMTDNTYDNSRVIKHLENIRKPKIKEEQPFHWTEKLIEEACYYVAENRHFINSLTAQYSTLIEQFKKSKQQTNTIPSGEEKLYGRCLVCGIAIKEGAKYCGSHWREYSFPKSQPKEERIEVEILDFEADGPMGYDRIFRATKKVGSEKFPLIKEAIEGVLNNEPMVTKLHHEQVCAEKI